MGARGPGTRGGTTHHHNARRARRCWLHVAPRDRPGTRPAGGTTLRGHPDPLGDRSTDCQPAGPTGGVGGRAAGRPAPTQRHGADRRNRTGGGDRPGAHRPGAHPGDQLDRPTGQGTLVAGPIVGSRPPGAGGQRGRWPCGRHVDVHPVATGHPGAAAGRTPGSCHLGSGRHRPKHRRRRNRRRRIGRHPRHSNRPAPGKHRAAHRSAHHRGGRRIRDPGAVRTPCVCATRPPHRRPRVTSRRTQLRLQRSANAGDTCGSGPAGGPPAGHHRGDGGRCRAGDPASDVRRRVCRLHHRNASPGRAAGRAHGSHPPGAPRPDDPGVGHPGFHRGRGPGRRAALPGAGPAARTRGGTPADRDHRSFGRTAVGCWHSWLRPARVAGRAIGGGEGLPPTDGDHRRRSSQPGQRVGRPWHSHLPARALTRPPPTVFGRRCPSIHLRGSRMRRSRGPTQQLRPVAGPTGRSGRPRQRGRT